MQKRKQTIIIEGLIGSGKTTFTRELGQELSAFGRGAGHVLTLFEPDEKDNANPYLSLFYEDPARWAYTMQTHLLSTRYRMHLHAQWHSMQGLGHAVLDRSFYGDTAFARLQVKNGTMTQKEFDSYATLYHAMTASVLLPTTCIHLKVSPGVSASRIAKRMEAETGRKCESAIDLDYLRGLDEEIHHMVDVLRKQGVHVIEVPWDEELTVMSRVYRISQLLEDIEKADPNTDAFLDLHRRTL